MSYIEERAIECQDCFTERTMEAIAFPEGIKGLGKGP